MTVMFVKGSAKITKKPSQDQSYKIVPGFRVMSCGFVLAIALSMKLGENITQQYAPVRPIREGGKKYYFTLQFHFILHGFQIPFSFHFQSIFTYFQFIFISIFLAFSICFFYL